MEIKSAEFVISNTNVKKCPTGDLPNTLLSGVAMLANPPLLIC